MHRPFEVLLLLSLVLNGASGQGYNPGRYMSPVLGVSESANQLRQQLEQSKKLRSAWKLNPKTACSRAASSTLCAASSSAEADLYGQVLLATSPDVYSSLEAKYVGNVRVVGPPGDQGGCSTCVAFAVASAAETAVATALRVDVQNCSISVQGLYFCGDPEANSVRGCADGWSIDLALIYLQQMGHMIPTKEGLPYLPDTYQEYTFEQMCGTKQEKPSPNIGLGRFNFRRLTNLLSAQEHIRQYGSIISRFDVYNDFKEFFKRPSNAKKVYKPGPNAMLLYPHAVVVVGYDNNEQYWLAKNSWGTEWGDGGFFKVAYSSCSLVTPETDPPYGVVWSPYVQPKMRQMQVRPAQQPGCFWYQARTGDCASMIAWRAGITLARFLYNNTQTIKSLDTPLDGQQVLLCDPKRGSIAYGDVDPQLQALMDLRAYIDQTGRMRSWSWETSDKGGYCNWQGIKCKTINGTRYISTVRIERNSRFVWLVGMLPPASVLLGMPGLKRLVIREQPGISGSIPEDWSNLTALRYLEEISLDLNSLAGSLPDSWSLLKQLKVLSIQSQNVAGNRKSIEGTLPHSWVNLTNMVQFRVANNFLTGTLPASYASMTQLQELKLWGNGFSGQLPPEWGTAFIKMEDLQMGRCELGGTIPAAWGGMTKVKKLYLNQNKFEGPLPESFGNLTAIVEMGLYGNDLTGTIPGSWSNGFKQIQKLDLSDNPDLKGCLPGELQHRLARWGWDMDVGIFQGTRITGC